MRKVLLAALWICTALALASCAAAQVETQAPNVDVTSYMQQVWQKYEDYTYDEGKNTLTLREYSTMSYESACAFGQNIYTDELALETYVDSVQVVADDLAATCNLPGVCVVLECISTDGEVLFTVASGGSITACWE
ncbi:MAG: hypothetical protein LBM28_05560 [Oscillospiraceae bacterium]|jgi:hypothetical protein|nr:hypothetical protein [Oscillospiraceae bacterium]